MCTGNRRNVRGSCEGIGKILGLQSCKKGILNRFNPFSQAGDEDEKLMRGAGWNSETEVMAGETVGVRVTVWGKTVSPMSIS